MARGDTVIANSEWTADHIRSIYPQASERLAIIPRGIDFEYFKPENVTPERVKKQREIWMVGPDERLILLPGRLSRWKGQHLFLDVLKRMKAAGQLPPGVKAVIAESFERIHRANLIGMGVVPLQFKQGTDVKTLGIDGTETFTIEGLEGGNVKPLQDVTMTITRKDGSTQQVPLTLRIDTVIEVDYLKHGGILPFVLRELMAA